MYLHIGLLPADKPCHRFLWRGINLNRVPDNYEFDRVVFGVNSSAFQEQFILQQHTRKYQRNYPMYAATIDKSTYMDNSMNSMLNEQQDAQVGQKSPTCIRLIMICYIVPKWRLNCLLQFRIWCCLKSFKITTMAANLDIGTKRFSNAESSCHPDASHQVLAQSDLLFGRRCGLKNFKMAAILDSGTGRFLQFWVSITSQCLPSCLSLIILTVR